MTTTVARIIGGLSLEIEERFPHYTVELGEMHGEPAVRVQSVWVVVDHDKFKVVVPTGINNASTGVGTDTRRVLFECSLISPTDDFENLFRFLDNWSDDEDDDEQPLMALRVE